MSVDAGSAADVLLVCSEAEQRAWLARPDAPLSFELIAELKRRSDSVLLSEPLRAHAISSCALVVAEHLPNEPLALALARWALGNWQAYHDPNAAIQSYQLALLAYRAINDSLSVARLLGNLVFAYSDCGRFPEAEQAYQEARNLYQAVGETASLYLLRLEQNYGWLLHNQGQYEQALLSYERSLALARRIDQGIIELEVLVNSAVTLGSTGRLADSESTLLQAQSLAHLHQQELTSARIELNLGWLYTSRGQIAVALRHFQTAHQQFALLGNQMEHGTVLLWEARLLERIGALREARLAYTQAAVHFEKLAMLPMLGHALLNQASIHRREGLFSQALQLLNKADELWQKLDQPFWQVRIQHERATLELSRHKPDQALSILTKAVAFDNNLSLSRNHELLFAEAHALRWQLHADQHSFQEAQRGYQKVQHNAEATGDMWVQRQALAGLGRLNSTHDPEAARSYLEAAAALDDMQRQALSVEELKASFQKQTADILPLLAQIATDQGQTLAALAYAWHSKGSALLDLLYAADNQQASASDDLRIPKLRQQIAALRWQQLHRAAHELEDAIRERSNPEIVRLEQELVSLRRQSNQRFQQVTNIGEQHVSGLLQHMQADWLIEYLQCDDRILVVCANAIGACHSHWIDAQTELMDLLDELELSFHNVLVQSGKQRLRFRELWLEESRRLLGQLYQLLFAPLEPGLTANKQPVSLLIAPCQPLYQLPFAALWDGAHYLTERYELSYMPSGALVAAPAVETTHGPALIIADSAEGQLLNVAVEAATVMAAIPGSVGLIDDSQALTHLQSLQLAPYILHIATHSVLREDAPIFSALQLRGGMLSVEQCYELPLRGTELVTLSSCVTGSGLESGGSLLAFQSAFFVAGAKRVISSLWQIDDQITAIWMGHFYRYLGAGYNPGRALSLTQRTMLAQDTYHPALWAAFVCSQRQPSESRKPKVENR